MEGEIQNNNMETNSNILDIALSEDTTSYIKVIGVGGAGTNAVNHMYKEGIKGVDMYVCNTDAKSLEASPVDNKISIGNRGAGNNPEKGKLAAEANKGEIAKVFDENARMVFITAGMGGGTGTGASPVVADIAKKIELPEEDENILVVAVVTLPFSFEGRKRRKQAEEGIERLKEIVDCIIIINTDKLQEKKDMKMSEAFAMADDVLLTAVKGISEIMTCSGYVQVDFEDVKSVMKGSGVALMGRGIAEGENRAMEAIRKATTSELLNDNDIRQTKNILISYTCSKEHDFTMEEQSIIMDYLEDITNPDLEIIWGITYDETYQDKLGITLIATGFTSNEIYTPQERKIGERNTIPAPTAVPLEPKPIQPISQTPATPSQSAATEVDMTDFKVRTIEDKTSEEKQPSAQEGGRTFIPVDEYGNPIKTKPEPYTPTTAIYGSSRPMETVSTAKQEQFGASHTPQSGFRQVEPKAQPHTSHVSGGIGGLRDAINGNAPTATVEATPTKQDAQKDFENRMARIARLRETMQTSEGLEQIINSHPTPENGFSLDYTYSAPQAKSSLSVNDSGNVEIQNNSAIDAQVD